MEMSKEGKNMLQRYMKITALLLLGCVVVLAGCTSKKAVTKTSVVEYLYPKGLNKAQSTATELKVPLKVGIAFVPEHGFISGALSEGSKAQLLEKVSEHFRGRDFVGSMQVVPSAYLTKGGSFANLDQIRTMYDIDIIALVSYDQVQFTDGGFLSLTYLTIIGAYIVSGERNDTSTMLDTVVYDIKSKKMLFRAPGVSNVKGRATLINVDEALRDDSKKGFDLAADDMITNLKTQLASFRRKIRQEGSDIKIVQP
jgi:rhombotail lipoprotein